MGLHAAFYGFFYDSSKVDALSARIDAVAQLNDPAERLLAYQNISDIACKPWSYLKPQGKATSIGLLLMFPVGFAASAMLANPIGGVMAIASVIVAHFVTGDFSSAPLFKVTEKNYDFKKKEIAAASLATMGASPKLDAVLASFPAIKKRFHDAAVLNAIKNEAQPQLPAPRALIEKRPQLPAA